MHPHGRPQGLRGVTGMQPPIKAQHWSCIRLLHRCDPLLLNLTERKAYCSGHSRLCTDSTEQLHSDKCVGCHVYGLVGHR